MDSPGHRRFAHRSLNSGPATMPQSGETTSEPAKRRRRSMYHNVRVCPDLARYFWIGGRDSVRDIRRRRSGSVNWEVASDSGASRVKVQRNAGLADVDTSTQKSRVPPCARPGTTAQPDRGDVQSLLPDRTSSGRKHVVCTPSNQSECSNHYYQNDRQHHRIFSDILPLFLRPELAKKISHVRTSAPQFYY